MILFIWGSPLSATSYRRLFAGSPYQEKCHAEERVFQLNSNEISPIDTCVNFRYGRVVRDTTIVKRPTTYAHASRFSRQKNGAAVTAPRRSQPGTRRVSAAASRRTGQEGLRRFEIGSARSVSNLEESIPALLGRLRVWARRSNKPDECNLQARASTAASHRCVLDWRSSSYRVPVHERSHSQWRMAPSVHPQNR